MVQYKKGSLVADDIHDLRTKFQNHVAKIMARSSVSKLDATLKKFCELQVWLVENKIKQNSSAKRSLEEATRFIDFLKEEKVPSTDLNSIEFEKALSKYWSHQINRNSIRRTGSNEFVESGHKLSMLGVDKIRQQLQLFLKYCIFEKEDLDFHSFKSGKIGLPLRITTRIENPYQSSQEVDEEQQMTIGELKLFCDWLEKKPGYMNQQLLTLLVFLSETGTRFSEAATLRISDIAPKGGLFICELRSSKTKLRPVILYYSKPYLKNWMGIHPQKNNPDALLFCEKNGSTASYSNLLKILKERICEYQEETKTELNWPEHKRFHWLRHLMATRTSNWPKQLQEFYLGWEISGRLGTYFEGKDPSVMEKIKTHYLEMLKQEKNPFMLRIHPHWLDEKEQIDKTQVEDELTEKVKAIMAKELREYKK